MEEEETTEKFATINETIEMTTGPGLKSIKGRVNELKEAKILILGLDKAGKTAIYNILTVNEPDPEDKPL